MAQRTLQQIIDQMNSAQAAEASLSGLNTPSQTGIYKMWIYIQALQQYLQEFLIINKQAEIETVVNSAISPSASWLQRMVFQFQYSATVPQIVAINNFSPSYPIIDPTLQIISRCSVITTAQRIVTVKVATGEPPTALSAPQLASLNGYLTQGGNGTVAGAGTGIAYAGVQIRAISLLPDRLFLEGTIFYDGQYASTIQSDCIAALDAYQAAIPFNGKVRVISITDALQAVSGFIDVNFKNIGMRAQTIAFANKTLLINNETEVLSSYDTFAGYIIQEDTSGQTFADKLTFVAS